MFEFWYALKEQESSDLILNNWLSTYKTTFIEVDNEDILKFKITLDSTSDVVDLMCNLGDDIVMFGDCINPKLSKVRSMQELGLV